VSDETVIFAAGCPGCHILVFIPDIDFQSLDLHDLLLLNEELNFGEFAAHL
jgi:hypothetical protein